MPYCQPGSEVFSLTAEQLEVSRSERMRLNGNGTLTLEDSRTWIEETGLCLFLPRRQFSSAVAPSFVEAVAGERNPTPDPQKIALAEELLVRLELDGVAVRLNLLGQPGEQPDFVVASWVLPYVYALRGDRDWRRSPQLTGSRQVSPLAIQAYKLLEAGDLTIPQLKHTLGREVTEGAVLRAITELWQQLRIIPVISAPGQAAQWQLLRQRFQKAIAEGASTSQVTAISVLASIYLQAVIAAGMEDVEMFLAPLTARSKVREVLRGLVATRQVHTISLGHAPHYYVAGTLPEFAVAPTVYASSSILGSAYFRHSRDEEEIHPLYAEPPASAVSLINHAHTSNNHIQAPAASAAEPAPVEIRTPLESHAARIAPVRKPTSTGAKSTGARPHFSRPAAHSRDRKPSQSGSSNRPARRPGHDSRSSAGARPAAGTRSNTLGRWNGNGASNGSSKTTAQGNGNGTHSNGTGAHPNGNGHGGHPAKAISNGHSGKAVASRQQRNGRPASGKPAGKTTAARGTAARKDARIDARSPHGDRKPALTAGAKAGNNKRYDFTAPSKQRTNKRG
jgi:hypothetical protein